MRRVSFVLFVVITPLTACDKPAESTGAATSPGSPDGPVPAGASTPTPDPTTAARAKLSAAADKLGKGVMGALQSALASSGPVGAVNVCGDSAAKITAEIAAAEGVQIRRTALELRNPANAPDDWERRQLEAWSASTEPPQPVFEIVGNEARLLRPIVLQPQCLACHGDPATQINKDVQAVLKQRYPNDRATGFVEGKLRGAISARLPLGG